jgi:cob(I)alamin adenosyltransferase
MSLYTRTGDGGSTSLFHGERVSKADPLVEAYGTVDELNAFLGAARVAVLDGLPDGGEKALVVAAIECCQEGLMRLAAELASGDGAPASATPADVADLERRIDAAQALVSPLTHFVIAGVSRAEAALHVARVVGRRAERRVVALGPDTVPPHAVEYLNRVSDLLFVLARACLRAAGLAERVWMGVGSGGEPKGG